MKRGGFKVVISVIALLLICTLAMAQKAPENSSRRGRAITRLPTVPQVLCPDLTPIP